MNIRRIIFYLFALFISLVIFMKYTPKREMPEIEVTTFPPKEYLDDLERLQIQ